MTTRIPTNLAAPAVRGPATQTLTKPAQVPQQALVRPAVQDAPQGIVAGGCFPPDQGQFPGGSLPFPKPLPRFPKPFPSPLPPD
ncbi:hypothetical protein ACLESD_26720, partial [Pyxidicoccus sp. 3LFB2]